ncbi:MULTISPECIES: peptide transporter [Cupriavidus]|uniref:Peptide transporter n=1 Tax=Cupriavidus pauculus TaxID=82633 RepID=A0A3G8H673_9BURK|nr:MULTISPECIES: peptide transporter [Cupriavidus]AZG16027.1 peptide transporter [Cupriavidus pauculus]MDT6964067.1 peptide transporter [Cupriavidus sp. SZY C1]
MKFDITTFEHHCYRSDPAIAFNGLRELLQKIADGYGETSHLDEWEQSTEAINIRDEHMVTRLAAAITALATNPDFHMSEQDSASVLKHQRWLASIFASSPFRNADHILRALGIDETARDSFDIHPADLWKFQLFYLPQSEIKLDWDALWKLDKGAAGGLAMAILSPRFQGTVAAHRKREFLLEWLPGRLDQVENLDRLPHVIMHDVNMFCSYADTPEKHSIKKPLCTLVRRKLAGMGVHDTERKAVAPKDGKKPVLLVVLESFQKNHSIYRTHSQTIDLMRRKFHVVGMGYRDRVDDAGRAVFDEFIELQYHGVWNSAAHVRDISEKYQAQMFYMPSVGMFAVTVVVSAFRVAPIQIMALGHPATTHSPAMDYVVVEQDYVGDPACFSEQLLVLPPDGMPYRPSANLLAWPPKPPARSSDVVKIAVAATTMKLNPGFIETCGAIAREARVPVEFHFLVGQGSGLVYPQVRNMIQRVMGNKAVVHRDQRYGVYMDTIASCQMFANPFPFGNTNGIVDTVWPGLVGVCKTGREVHEHIDEGMFRRLGFPEWTIAKTVDEYKAAVIRMAENHEEREALAAKLAGREAIETHIFKGRPEILGERMYALWSEQVANENANRS